MGVLVVVGVGAGLVSVVGVVVGFGGGGGVTEQRLDDPEPEQDAVVGADDRTSGVPALTSVAPV